MSLSHVQIPAAGLDRDLKSASVTFSHLQALPEIWPIAAQTYGRLLALHAPHLTPAVQVTYQELAQQIQAFAAGLQSLGVNPGDRITLFADNSPRWLVADQGSMMAGAVNVVRSSQADIPELIYIQCDSGAQILIAEDQDTLKKLAPDLASLNLSVVILLTDETPQAEALAGVKLLNFNQVLQAGTVSTFQVPALRPADLATLIYTSGTTGKPKGVMLTHANLLHQINTMGVVLQPNPGDKIVSILPTWHSYERACEYFLFSRGCTQTYSNLRHIKQDLKEIKPNYMVAVPRLWESVYEGVQRQLRDQPANKQKLVNFFMETSTKYIQARRRAQGLSLELVQQGQKGSFVDHLQAFFLAPIHKLGEKIVYEKIRQATGGNLKTVISGGGSLARHLEIFYELIGIEILVGYGLTETSPVLTVRRTWENLRSSAGKPLPSTEIKIVDPETRQTLPLGTRGLVLARGPQIMKGYYNNPSATAKVIDSEGWFDTGDLGWITPRQDLVLTGRQKDTIVLTNGENIEPQPIEDACLRSAYIDQMMLVGQDQRVLGALIVPNLINLQQWAAGQNYTLDLPDHKPTDVASQTPSQPISLNDKLVQELYRRELTREVQNRPGYRPDDRIGCFQFVLEPFSIENGLMTQTLKIRRNVVMDRYHDMINGMFE